MTVAAFGPGRVNLIGEHTDYNGGLALPFAIAEGVTVTATAIDGDCRSYGHLPYFVDKYIGPGWTCVGDAGGFLDPFYSPGLDQMEQRLPRGSPLASGATSTRRSRRSARRWTSPPGSRATPTRPRRR